MEDILEVRTLNRAVQEAFEGLLQSNYSPSFFLYLELDREKIDVNIHPQKTEVKFEDREPHFRIDSFYD